MVKNSLTSSFFLLKLTKGGIQLCQYPKLLPLWVNHRIRIVEFDVRMKDTGEVDTFRVKAEVAFRVEGH